MNIKKLNEELNNVLIEDLNNLNDFRRLHRDLELFREKILRDFPGDKEDAVHKIDDIIYIIEVMWDGEEF